MTWLEPVTLSNSRICLELLDQRHHDELVEATNDGEWWKLWYPSVPRPDDVAAEIERRLELCRQHSMLPFAIVEQSSGRAVGMTTFMNADAANRRIEIGSTWFRRSTQRTGLNTHCKLLVLTRAFTELISLIGRAGRASNAWGETGSVQRSHRILARGTLQDTCVYSIISSERPTVQTHLTFRASRSH